MKNYFIYIIFMLSSILFAQDSGPFEQVQELLRNRETVKAEQIIRNILTSDENNAEALYYLGVVHLVNGDYEQAIDQLEEAIELNDKDYRFFERLGDAFGMKAQKAGIFKAMFVIGDMRSNWEKAIELNPGLVPARERLISYYLAAPGIAGGDDDKALKLAQEVIELDPAKGYYLRSRYYTKVQEPDNAEKDLLKSVELDSTNGDILNNIAYFYLNQNKLQLSKKYFNQYIAHYKDEPNPYDSKGDYFVKTGQLDSALVMYQTAIQKNPNFEPSLYNQALMLKDLSRLEEAKQAAGKYLNKFPDGRYADAAQKIIDD